MKKIRHGDLPKCSVYYMLEDFCEDFPKVELKSEKSAYPKAFK